MPTSRSRSRPRTQVDGFLPPFDPVQQLDPADPYSIGAMVGPEAFTEVRYLAHHKQMQALERIPPIAREFAEVFGREAGGLLRPYRTDGAETVVVALGSVNGTVKDVVDSQREAGQFASEASRSAAFRPFPLGRPVCDALWPAPSAWSAWRRAWRRAWVVCWPPTCAWPCGAIPCRSTP